jgi:hypothetical protein
LVPDPAGKPLHEMPAETRDGRVTAIAAAKEAVSVVTCEEFESSNLRHSTSMIARTPSTLCRTSILLLFVNAPLHAADPIPAVPPGDGQITRPVTSFPDSSAPDQTFFGQQTITGKLVLTASNGFFDSGMRAGGQSAVKDAAGVEFIGPDFEYLNQWNKPATTLRWHLWVAHPGKLFINSHFVVGPADAGSKLDYSLGGTHLALATRAESDADRPQGAPLAFEVAQPGWQTLTVRLDSLVGKEVGKLHRLELFGPAAAEARVLRARWRPAACHARFSSSTMAAPMLWVMTTRIAESAKVPSYSPVTTPFGYFGTSFKADGTSSGTANFSLWSFSAGRPKPQEQWSHMLAAGSAEAEFGSFGHEGSGVKLRGDWSPFGNDTREVTLALRGEASGPWVRWFGYFLDPKSKRFRLYAAAAEWNGNKPMRSLNPGAFVEQPGPPDRERSGDLVRDIQRRGWMLDAEKTWHSIDTMQPGKGLAAKHWRKTGDGWFSMGMGGMVYEQGSGEPVTLDPATQTKPDWLQGDQALKDLFKLPATIGPRKIKDISRTSAKVVIPLSGLDLADGEKASLTVFHGPEDCLTFDRELGYREVKTRFWPHRSEAVSATDGDNTVELRNLSPGGTHHFRILIESSRGRIWSFETDHFSTLP